MFENLFANLPRAGGKDILLAGQGFQFFQQVVIRNNRLHRFAFMIGQKNVSRVNAVLFDEDFSAVAVNAV